MKKYAKQQEEVNQQWNQLEPQELDSLRAEMNKKKQERMNGRLQSRFFQVMFDWDVLRLLPDGMVSVKKPLEYTRWIRANAMIESADAKEQERIFEMYPEQRVEWEKKFQAWMQETRKAVFGLKDALTVEN